VNVAAYFAQMLKIFAQIMANFSALGMRPHPLHPHAVRLWARMLLIGNFMSDCSAECIKTFSNKRNMTSFAEQKRCCVQIVLP